MTHFFPVTFLKRIKSLTDRLNCWEFNKCGREVDGSNVEMPGICPSAIDDSYNGLNGGKNGGRICWAVAGTFCEGKVQGSFVKKLGSCLKCDFLKIVLEEEGPESFEVLK